ncbi:putative transmembrane protein [Toxoplasma gondii RUB]|nr:putative transmembrane protein [Toxoplasma gondii RUB]
MLAVPEENRFFAVAASILVMHTLGDIPFPVVVGYVKDRLAPHCAQISPEDGASAACRAEEAGLRWTLFLIFSVLLLMAAATFAAKAVADRKMQTEEAANADGRDTDARHPSENNPADLSLTRGFADTRQDV